MNSKDLKFILAPFGVAIGISIFTFIYVLITRKFGIVNLHKVLSFMPQYVLIIIGILFIITFMPMFILSVYFLGRRGAVGQSSRLTINGIYRYVRNPMYSGVSFTILGLGILLNKTAIALAGITWLCLTYVQCKREEKELAEKFGKDYVNYKNNTPLYIPKFDLIIKDLLRKVSK